MATPNSFASLQERITARWMKRPKVRALIGQAFAQADLAIDRLAGSIEARCVELAPADALDAIGGTCALSRADGESDDDFRSYLRDPWSRWHKSGTNLGLLAELSHLGNPSAQIITYWDIVAAGVPANVAFGGNTSCFFVLLPYPNVFAPPKYWGTSMFLGTTWTGDVNWGVFGDPQIMAAVQRSIATLKPADTSCRFIVVGTDSNFQWGAPLWGEVNWDAFDWGVGFSGGHAIVPCIEPWEIGADGSQRREFYNYSYLKERVT